MNRLIIEDSFLFLLSLLLLADSNGVGFLFLLAALLHEAGHYLVLSLCGGHLVCLKLTAAGAVMRFRMGHAPLKRCLIALAGPAASLLTALFMAKAELYRFAGANLLLGLFNLIPIYPLDGAAALASLIERWPRVVRVISLASCALLLLGGITTAWANYGIALLIMAVYLTFQQKNLLIMKKRDTITL